MRIYNPGVGKLHTLGDWGHTSLDCKLQFMGSQTFKQNESPAMIWMKLFPTDDLPLPIPILCGGWCGTAACSSCSHPCDLESVSYQLRSWNHEYTASHPPGDIEPVVRSCPALWTGFYLPAMTNSRSLALGTVSKHDSSFGVCRFDFGWLLRLCTGRRTFYSSHCRLGKTGECGTLNPV
jgi:hypothetical protein